MQFISRNPLTGIGQYVAILSMKATCAKSEILQHAKRVIATHNCWNHMIQRCTNEKDIYYGEYGGRGITVCDRWFVFDNFVEDMGLIPPHRAIDRIDNDAGYSPENCRWATRRQNQRNTRKSRIWRIRGREYETCLDAAAGEGVSADKIRKMCLGVETFMVCYLPEPGCSSGLKYPEHATAVKRPAYVNWNYRRDRENRIHITEDNFAELERRAGKKMQGPRPRYLNLAA